jgi:hypothetical protein
VDRTRHETGLGSALNEATPATALHLSCAVRSMAQMAATSSRHSDTLQGADDPSDRRFHTAIVILILVTAALGALVFWLATVIGGRASVLDQSSTLELVKYQTLLTRDQQLVANDVRLLAPYQEAKVSNILLTEQARHHRDLAAELRGEARTEKGVVEELLSAFSIPPTTSADGTVSYPVASCRESSIGGTTSRRAAENACDVLIEAGHLGLNGEDLTQYHPHDESLWEQAKRLHERSVRLVMVAALFATALVLFTLAQLPRGLLRRWTTWLGVATLVAAISLALYVGSGV